MKSPAVRLWWLLPIVAALAWWGLRPVPVKVELATVAERELVESVRDEGRTRVIHRYRLSAPVQGQLERIELRVGDQVEAGQVLARVLASTGALLDAASRRRVQAEAEAARAATAQAEARRNAAEATAQWAAADAERIRPLVQAGTLSKSEGERAETALRQAQAELRAARFAEQVARAQAAAAQALLEQQTATQHDRVRVRWAWAMSCSRSAIRRRWRSKWICCRTMPCASKPACRCGCAAGVVRANWRHRCGALSRWASPRSRHSASRSSACW